MVIRRVSDGARKRSSWLLCAEGHYVRMEHLTSCFGIPHTLLDIARREDHLLRSSSGQHCCASGATEGALAHENAQTQVRPVGNQPLLSMHKRGGARPKTPTLPKWHRQLERHYDMDNQCKHRARWRNLAIVAPTKAASPDPAINATLRTFGPRTPLLGEKQKGKTNISRGPGGERPIRGCSRPALVTPIAIVATPGEDTKCGCAN